jgi:hypothetical protein
MGNPTARVLDEPFLDCACPAPWAAILLSRGNPSVTAHVAVGEAVLGRHPAGSRDWNDQPEGSAKTARSRPYFAPVAGQDGGLLSTTQGIAK